MSNPGPIAITFLGRLTGVKQTGSGWMARCPCRDDDANPSLSIAEGDDGRVLVNCHRGNGCDVNKICSSVGMTVAELMPPREESYKKKDVLTKVAVYDFTDEHGHLLFQKVRYVNQDGIKTFRQRKPDGNNGWTYSLGDTPKVLYNLPAVLRAKQEGEPIWVVEGEKDANTLIDLGICATTMPGGAGKWLDIHTAALAGAVVEIVADNDGPGKNHALKVLNELTNASCSVQAWICPEKKDITDHLSSGGKIEQLLPFEDVGESEQVEDREAPSEQVSEHEPEVGLKELAIARASEIITRDDLSAQQKLSKLSLVLSAAIVANPVDPGRLIQWNDFIAESSNDNYEWVIPGLLEKGERVIVVAAEGVGKTMLARQIALCSAAGLHPFTFQPIRPVITLTVDLENPERIIRRMSTSIVNNAMAKSGVKSIQGHILTKPAGMDLLKAQDRLVLEEAIEKIKPDILVLGPLYKSFVDPGGRTSEAIAVEIAKYLDTLRVVYGCALWLEHHAPLGTTMSTRDLRPFGSAVWSRWPEFGISLQPDPTAVTPFVYDVRHFRGARDERPWPLKITRGKRFPFEVLEYNKINT